MKKTFTILLTLVMVMGLLISCDDSRSPKDLCGEVKMEGGAKALSASTELPGADTLYWTYTARRTDGGFYITGQELNQVLMKKGTTPDPGLPSTLGQFSYGTWEFEFFAYSVAPTVVEDEPITVDSSKLVFKGTTSDFKVSKATQSLTMTVELAQSTGKGQIVFDTNGLTFNFNSIDEQVSIDASVLKGKTVELYMDIDGTPLNKIGEITLPSESNPTSVTFLPAYLNEAARNYLKEVDSGVHVLTFILKFQTSSGTYEVLTYDAVAARIVTGGTTTISGTFTFSEEEGLININSEIKKPVFDTKLFVPNETKATSTTGETTVVITSNEVPDKSEVTEGEGTPATKKTEVTFPEAVFGNYTDVNHRLDMEIIPIEVASTKFTVEAETKTPVAGVDLTLTKITVSEGETPITEPVTDFGGNYVTILTYIAKGLEQVDVRYNGTGKDLPVFNPVDGYTELNQVDGTGYIAETGLLVFKTNHFSEYYVVADAEAINVTTNRGYKTFAEAIAAAEDGDEIKLVKHVVANNSFVIDKEISLNLNGKTITAASDWKGVSPTSQALFFVKSGAIFTIDDSEGNGGILAENKSIYSAVTMTIKDHNDDSKIAKLIVNGGTLKGFYYGVATNGTRHNTEIVINGGTLTGFNPEGATSIYHPNRGKLTINGGTLTGYNGIAIKGGTDVTITGGTFKATGAKVVPEEAASSGCRSVGSALYVEGNYSYGAKVYISGGKFTTTDPNAPAVLAMFNEEPVATIEITGGTYSSEPDEEYVAEDYETYFVESDNLWHIREIGPKAQIGTTIYDTLGGAIAAVNSGETIKLISDIDISYDTTTNFEVVTLYDIPSGKNFVLDFNGHYIKATKSKNVKIDPRVCIFRIPEDATVSFVSNVESKGLLQTDLAWEMIANNGSIPLIDNLEIKSTETTTAGKGTGTDNGWSALIWNYKTGTIEQISNSLIGLDGTGTDEIDVLTNYGTIGTISDSKIYCHQAGALTYKYAVTNLGTINKITKCILAIESDISSESHQQNFTLYNSGTIGELDATEVEGLLTAISNGGNINKFSSAENVISGQIAGGGVFNITAGTFSEEVNQSYLAPEYMCKQVGDVYTIEHNKAAYDQLPKKAAIGEVEYVSFSGAYAAAKSGDAIKLLADIDQQILINKAITLDLNGNNIVPTNADKSYAVRVNNGHVVITDSTDSPGSIGTADNHNWWYTLMVGGLNSDLTIEKISIYDGATDGVYLIGGTNNAVVNFNSGTIYANNSNTAGISIGATNGKFNMSGNAKVIVASDKTGVNINIGDYGKTTPTFNMNGGTIICSGSGNGIVNQSVDYGKVNLKNATITTESGTAINVGGCTIDNCTITSNSSALSFKHDGYDRAYNDCTVTIKGDSTITGSIYFKNENKWTVVIKNGTYNKSGKNQTWFEKYVDPDKYELSVTGTTACTVTEKNPE